MRWVRTVLDLVNWYDDDDPILKELTSIGPCVFDEIQKLPEGCWRFDETGKLILQANVTGTTEIAVETLSFRDIKALREKFLSQLTITTPNETVGTTISSVVEVAKDAKEGDENEYDGDTQLCHSQIAWEIGNED